MASSAEVPAALRREVRHLSTLLGHVLEEAGGPELLADVERLRRATIAVRRDPTEARRRHVLDVVGGFDLERAEHVARAFTVYFQLVNLAEEHQRTRALRERSRETSGPAPDSVADAVDQVRATEGDDGLHELLYRLEITPVLTAHPTEAKRRAVVETLWRTGELLERRDDPRLSGVELADLDRRLAEEVTALWLTDPLRSQRPRPLDEVRAAMALFDATIFRVVPRVYREIDRALSPGEAGARRPAFAPFLRWGSWIGGDRDGNPAVSADVTRATLEIQAEHVLLGLEAATRRIAHILSASERETPPSEELLASLKADETDLRRQATGLRRKLPDAPHRRKLGLIAERLVRTRHRLAGGYDDHQGMREELEVVQRSLAAAGSPRLAYGELQHLIWQVETFGFHLASLEVRQHSAVHASALTELAPGTASDPEALDLLATEGWSGRATTRPSEPTREVLATFRVMAELQQRFGPGACRRYVVSFTRGAADVLAVHALARLAAGGEDDHSFELDVVPLFESRADLDAAPRVLDELLAFAHMRAWLDARDRRMEVMLGYSDSAKDVGVLAANLALHRAQGELAAWAQRNDIALTLFHGRGGALGRGGGPANRAILGQAPGSVDGRFKVTEQGEVSFARYGNLQIAERHLEQIANAVLIASTPASERRAADGWSRFGAAAKRMADASERAYRDLVEREGFAEFFARVTPMHEIERLRIGSRPARRARDTIAVEDLRAIPWVFAWTQNRCNLPGWYGLGAGLEVVADERGGLPELRAMYRDWPFFTSLLENVELSLAKADLPIAQLYLALGDRPDLAKTIEHEFERTRQLVLEVTQNDRPLAARPVLRRAIELRNPYVDALSFLQVRFLEELRSGAPDHERTARLRRLAHVTINGVAAGLQNAG